MLLQLASLICASCDAGVKLDVDPNGDIIEDIARFSFDGVLLNESARPTCTHSTCIIYFLHMTKPYNDYKTRPHFTKTKTFHFTCMVYMKMNCLHIKMSD